MTMSINRPTYDNSGGAGHSLDEIAIQGGSGNGNIVELGWLVSSDMNPDADPHIFVFHWVNDAKSCYNGCGWKQYSNTYFPGQNIRPILRARGLHRVCVLAGQLVGLVRRPVDGVFPGIPLERRIH